ncbi:ankyrin repeat-containing domain protein [Aspergillus granulosus]|uniref:Ankyrin repeat-containing domain protein n=1 Tax=Aspergillus granulosus TaxID=176169 RepID=A0ABR4H643_9EURO
MLHCVLPPQYSLQTLPPELQLMVFDCLDSLGKAALIESEILSSELLLSGCRIDECEEHGLSMLHAAAHENYVNTARLLLSASAATSLPSQAMGDCNATPIVIASECGNLEIIHLLMDHGASVAEWSHSGITCLHHACRSGQTRAVEILLDYGADVNKSTANIGTPLHVAAAEGYADIVRILLTHGAKVNILGDLIWRMTPLQNAALKGDPGCVRLLLEAGAIATYEPTPEQPGHFIHPPNLHMVAAGPHYNDADTFVHLHHWRPQERPAFAWKPGEKESYAEILRLLIDAGADISQVRMSGSMTPLHLAVIVGSRPAVEILLAEGADVNARTDKGHSVIYFARLMGYGDIVEMLSEARERRPEKRRKPVLGPKPKVQFPLTQGRVHSSV